MTYEPLFQSFGTIRPEVKVDFGARSTGEPHAAHAVVCDAAAYLPDLTFPEARPAVMLAERTFWEKATSMHVHCLQGRRRGERWSRHWHDLARLDDAGIAARALAEQAAGWLRRKARLSISHETIYRHIWRDRKRGGRLYLHLRCSPKQRRKRYGSYDSRGRLAGKRPISERPAGAQNRSRVGHLEADTVIGTSSDKHCVLTFVDRKTGYVMIGKLEARTVEATNRRAVQSYRQHPR